MSVITPRNGLRVRLQRLTRGAVVFAIALGAVGVGGGQAFAATEEEPEPTVDLVVAAGVNGTVAPGTPFSATVTVDNGIDQELSAGYVTIELNRTPLADGAAVTSWLDSGETGGDFQRLASESTPIVDAEESGTASVFIPADAVGALAPGVYPLRATLAGAATGDGDTLASHDAAATTVLVVTATSPANVGVLVPITATPADGALLTAAELTELTAAGGALTAQLDGVSGTGAILAIDPAIVAAIRVLGAAAPAEATDWLARLDSLPNERFALQFADADPTTQAHAGLPSLLGPSTLTPFLDPANFPVVTPTTSPTPGPTPSESATPELPHDDELTDISGARSGILWPRADTTTDDLATFANYVGDSPTTLLPSTSVDGERGPHGTTGGHELLLIDPAVSAALSRAAAEPDPIARERWLAAASAQLHLSSAATSGLPVLVGLDRDEDRDADALRSAVTALSSLPTSLAVLRSAPASAVTLTAEPEESRDTALRTLLDEEEELTEFASILADPQLLLSPERIRILRVIAVGVPSDAFAPLFTDHRRTTEATLNAVGVTRPSVIRLFGTVADLPVWVRNDLPWPVSVRLSTDSSDLKLDVEPVTDVEVLPASNTRVKVPIVARVGSGEVNVALSLTSPTGVPIGDDQNARVVVRAEWEQIGLIVFGSLAVLLIAGGVFRTVRRRRREKEAEAAADADASDDTSDEPGAAAPEKEPHE